jgi:hypothetical protein
MRHVAMWLFMFCATAAIDVVWARYTVAAAERRALHAAFWSAAIYIGGSVTMLAYIADNVLLLPCVLGAFAGTYVGVRRGA